MIEQARTLISDTTLPGELWNERLKTAVYLPQIHTKRKPYVGHLVPVGTKVFVLINDRRIGKFDPKTEKRFVLGFTERRNTYKVYIPARNKVRISCDVIFTPDKFGLEDQTLEESKTTEKDGTGTRPAVSLKLLRE